MEILGVTLHKQTPTILSARKLYSWSKYCNGECVDGDFRYGAVKPPAAEYKWFPAAIGSKNVMIACSKAFPSPEKALVWLRAAGKVRCQVPVKK